MRWPLWPTPTRALSDQRVDDWTDGLLAGYGHAADIMMSAGSLNEAKVRLAALVERTDRRDEVRS